MAKEEADRVEQQRVLLGENGLAKKAELLEKAMATNELPPPAEMLTKIPIPDVKNINSLPSTVKERGEMVYGDAKKLDNLDVDQFPVPVHVTACGVDSNFGYVRDNKLLIICMN